MGQGNGAWHEIEELAASIPYDGSETHAQWGRRFADVLMANGSDEAILAALENFGEQFLSKRFSEERRGHREVGRKLARGTFNGHSPEVAMRTLDLPIGVPGEGTRRLGEINHWWIKGAIRAVDRQLDGLGANRVRLVYYHGLTAPWPDDPVATLVADGRVGLDSLVFPDDDPPALPGQNPAD